MIVDVIASRTASAPCPARARPFLTLSRPRCGVGGAASESGGAFDRDVPDRGAAKADDEVAFPVSRNRSVLGLGGPLADHDVGAYKLLAATTAASPSARAAPARCAGRPSARGAVPPAPGCTALGKSPRARPSSIHRRDTRSGADGRSAAGSTMSPNVGPDGGHDVDHSRSPRLGQARASRPQPSLCLRGGPARSSSADRSRPAWLSSGAWHVGRCATAQSTPDTPDRRSESPRCDVALARQSTGLSGADGQCPRTPAP